MAFEAKYPGRCADCGEDIERGDLIQYDEDSRIVHADCDPEPTAAERPTETCTECWLIKPCGCEEF